MCSAHLLRLPGRERDHGVSRVVEAIERLPGVDSRAVFLLNLHREAGFLARPLPGAPEHTEAGMSLPPLVELGSRTLAAVIDETPRRVYEPRPDGREETRAPGDEGSSGTRASVEHLSPHQRPRRQSGKLTFFPSTSHASLGPIAPLRPGLKAVAPARVGYRVPSMKSVQHGLSLDNFSEEGYGLAARETSPRIVEEMMRALRLGGRAPPSERPSSR